MEESQKISLLCKLPATPPLLILIMSNFEKQLLKLQNKSNSFLHPFSINIPVASYKDLNFSFYIGGD